MNFGSFKSLGQSISSSLSELEHQLTQASTGNNTVTSPTATTPQRPTATSNRSSPAPHSPTSPTSPTTTTTSPTPFSRESFRERLRKQREQATQQRRVASDSTPTAPAPAPAAAPPPAASTRDSTTLSNNEGKLNADPSTDAVKSSSSASLPPAGAPLSPPTSTSTTIPPAAHPLDEPQVVNKDDDVKSQSPSASALDATPIASIPADHTEATLPPVQAATYVDLSRDQAHQPHIQAEAEEEEVEEDGWGLDVQEEPESEPHEQEQDPTPEPEPELDQVTQSKQSDLPEIASADAASFQSGAEPEATPEAELPVPVRSLSHQDDDVPVTARGEDRIEPNTVGDATLDPSAEIVTPLMPKPSVTLYEEQVSERNLVPTATESTLVQLDDEALPDQEHTQELDEQASGIDRAEIPDTTSKDVEDDSGTMLTPIDPGPSPVEPDLKVSATHGVTVEAQDMKTALVDVEPLDVDQPASPSPVQPAEDVSVESGIADSAVDRNVVEAEDVVEDRTTGDSTVAQDQQGLFEEDRTLADAQQESIIASESKLIDDNVVPPGEATTAGLSDEAEVRQPVAANLLGDDDADDTAVSNLPVTVATAVDPVSSSEPALANIEAVSDQAEIPEEDESLCQKVDEVQKRDTGLIPVEAIPLAPEANDSSASHDKADEPYEIIDPARVNGETEAPSLGTEDAPRVEPNDESGAREETASLPAVPSSLPSTPPRENVVVRNGHDRADSSSEVPDLAATSASPSRSAAGLNASAKDARLSEITTAYKRLQTLKTTLDRIALDAFPTLNGVQDAEAFERELGNLRAKAELEGAERAKLASQLQQQKDRLEEVRDTHRLEAKSSSDTLDALRSELAAKDAALKTLSERLHATGSDAKQRLATQTEEYERLKIVAKEEEEKRVKALSLLRALRQKLVKCERDKEDVERDRNALKEAHEGAKLERVRQEQEVVSLRAAHEQQLAKTRASFEREIASAKAQADKDARERKSQFELEVITARAAAARELKDRDGRITALEQTVRDVERAKVAVFETMQARSAEAEAARTEAELSREQLKEVQYELSEVKDRATALQDEVEQLRRARRDETRDDSLARRSLVEAEQRHEVKVKELEARARQLELDRHDTEAEMGRNLQDRLREVERMRSLLAQKDVDYAESVHSTRVREQRIEEGDKLRIELQARLKSVEAMLQQVKEDAQLAARAEAAVREELEDRNQRATELEARLEEVQVKESSLRSSNKVLREELRKLQSGVLQSDKQRNPGVGYFSSFNQSSSGLVTSPGSSGHATPPPPSLSTSSMSMMSPAAAPSTTSTGTSTSVARASAADEALNFEYLRNVILQFLERPDMRPHLISVLGVILHFTPAEQRRLVGKAGQK